MTQTKTVKIPDASHPITIDRTPARVVVKFAGKVIADSRDALTLKEASYPAVQYIPRKDVDMAALQATDHATYCPYKGDCRYFSIAVGEARAENAVWTYESPYPSVAPIRGYVAFYPDRVESIELIA